ncbi:MAG TPA: GYD domain-containing protein [Acidobacteriaceae bacterium]
MPTYIAMVKWTQQGLKDIKDSASRLDVARKNFESAGVTIKDFYMVMGRYDNIAIMEAPDDASVAVAMLKADSLGSITSETCRAFTEDEYRQIISRVG